MIPKEITADLKNGLTLEETLNKHNTNLKELFAGNKDKKQIRKNPNWDITWQHIQLTKSGTYKIEIHRKKKRCTYGTYKTLKEAQLVRDKLIECNWDKKQLTKILTENNILPRRKGGWQQ